jgi:hypothetical protein
MKLTTQERHLYNTVAAATAAALVIKDGMQPSGVARLANEVAAAVVQEFRIQSKTR